MKKIVDGMGEIEFGRFGRHIIRKLNEMNHQVMAIDHNDKGRGVL